MTTIVEFPLLFFGLSLVVLYVSAMMGAVVRKRWGPLEESERQDLGLVLTSTLTLLGLIIGFGFSMVVNRYDQRKNCEAEETNAIGTEYVRADLLPPTQAARIREVLKDYLDQRVLFYQSHDADQLGRIALQTSQLRAKLWSIVTATAAEQPTPTVTLAVSGMNDVLNSQGFTEAAWRNRLPIAAWWLVVAIAIFCNQLVGFFSHEREPFLLLVLPLALAVSFFLLAEIDSPRHGFIRVAPVNLISLSQSLRPR